MKNNLLNPTFRLLSKAFVLASFVWFLLCSGTYANNISVTNMDLVGQNPTINYIMVQFDISWENSWRTSSAPNNWDAAWVFVKYRVTAAYGGDGLWKHATLNTSGHTTPVGSTILPATDGTGVFFYRNADGTGTFSKTGVQLQWNYGVNYKTGTTPIGDNDVVDVQVYAIETVYVPQGAFYVGDGTTSSVTGQFNVYNSTAAYQITSESVPSTLGGSSAGNMRNNNRSGMLTSPDCRDDFRDDNRYTQTLPAAFPKGFNAFYCMKYEISQQGYVDFLNTLTYTQQTARTVNAPNSAAGTAAFVNGNRNGIDVQTPGVSTTVPAVYACNLDNDGLYGEATDGQWVACGQLNYDDVEAYLDWSALRPMTELEFEKASRGPASALANEYVWGSTSITQNTGITNSGLINETSTNSGNATYGNHGSVIGPLRVGALATAASTRVTSGASYYGIMDLSGNLFERTVSVGRPTGRTFTGVHGNGSISNAGVADASLWPTTANIRGGSYARPATELRVSDRYYGALQVTTRAADYGGRGVRLEPVVAP